MNNELDVSTTEPEPTETALAVTTTANTPEETQKDDQQIGLNDLSCGFVAGITDNGNFVFELVGKDKDLLKLVGVAKFAEMKVQQTFDATQMTGDTLVHEVGKALSVINQKLDAVVQATKKPDTQL